MWGISKGWPGYLTRASGYGHARVFLPTGEEEPDLPVQGHQKAIRVLRQQGSGRGAPLLRPLSTHPVGCIFVHH